MDLSMTDNRSPRKAYGEVKKKYQIMLTPAASTALEKMSDRLGITRSECVERMIRWVDERWDTQLARDLATEKEGDRNADP